MRRNFLHHLHPPQIRQRTVHPLTTLGLGIASLTCLGVLLATGFTLFLYYVPDQEKAYERILHISTTLHYGGLVRNLHFVAANALVILAVLHLARVFLTGAYRGRRLNWLYGLAMLFLLLLSNFTGYLLPWDQISYWAAQVGAGLAAYFPLVGTEAQRLVLGGTEVSGETLLRSFALHAGAVPLLLVVLAALHLWRIRKDGGLAAPPAADRERLPTDPWLYRAEGAVALLTFAALVGLALVLPATLAERADPLHPPNPAKAPWYFVGLQEMVSHSAFFGGVVAPALIAIFLISVPWLDRSPNSGGQWFARDRRRLDIFFILLLLSQITLIIVGRWLRGPNWALVWPFSP
ncbi:cytochrome b N-terminal domain-containing protein [Desulfuromonas sp. TF]|uniref:cytochrome b N-terminal domain-containing protein n=1 Tax=Desulfuromonas sp. TF TaxID=1232410 RepID=UPI0004272C5D|nr:cytochrome b N-terminal domain-containing protein [Desulfuromonas sp. TF]